VFSLRSILIAQVILWMLGLFQNAIYWQHSPERVATHFNGLGKADGWMHRDAATLMMVGFQTLMPLIFMGIAYSIFLFPASLINIPNRDFWLAPERRDESLAFVARTTALFSLAISLFFSGMNHLTFRANQEAGDLSLVGFWVLLVSFLAFTASWVAVLLFRFRVPKGAL